MIDDLSIHVLFENKSKKIINGSIPVANDKLQFAFKSLPKSTLLSCAKPRTKRSSRKFGSNSTIHFLNKHSKNEVLNKSSKSEHHILSVNLGDKIAAKDGFSSFKDLSTQGAAEKTRNVGKENLHLGIKGIPIKGNLKSELDTATICNERRFQRSARRCLFIDSKNTLPILDKSMEKNAVAFQSDIATNSAQYCEDFNVIEAQNSSRSPVFSANKLKNKNGLTCNRTFNSISESKENYVSMNLLKNKIQYIGSVCEKGHTTEKINHLYDGNNKGSYERDCTLKNSKKYKDYYCFFRSNKSNNSCSKVVHRAKIEKRHFEPISDDEQEEFIIEQFLSQSEVDTISKDLQCPSKTMKSKIAINFENLQANNHNKFKHFSSLDISTETDNFDTNKSQNFNYRIKESNISEINISSRGSKRKLKTTIARPGTNVVSNIQKNTSLSQVLKFKTESKLNVQKSLSKFNVEKKEIQSSKFIPVIDQCSHAAHNPKSPVLSEKIFQNQNSKEILDFDGYNTNITSPILSGKSSQNQSNTDILDPYSIDDKTYSLSPILSGKRSQNQSIGYKSKSIGLDKIAISLSLNCKSESLIASETVNDSIDLFSTKSPNVTQKPCLPLKMQTSILPQKRHYTHESLTWDSSSQFKILQLAENSNPLIEEYPTQLTFIEQPMKALKKFKSHNGFDNSETTFSNSNVSHNYLDKDKELEIENNELNSNNGTPTSNDFTSKTDLKPSNELIFRSSTILNRSTRESNDIIEDFTSQEKSDNVLTDDVIETQSSPIANSSISQIEQASEKLQSVPVMSTNRFNEKADSILLDSPEKKHRKPKPGSLSHRMKRLLHFQRSKFCMWKHNGESNVTNNSSTLRVNKIWNEFGKVIIDCCQNITFVGNEKTTTGEVHANILAIVEPGAASDVSENCVISVHPPWQSMIFEEINLIVVLNVTRLEIVSRFSNPVQPQTCKIENKKFSCLCIENASHCNFSLPLRGMELTSSWFKVNGLNNPKCFQAGERSIAAAITNSFLTTQLTLDISVLHQFRCIDKADRESLNAIAIDKNGDICQIALKTPMDENRWQQTSSGKNKMCSITGLVLNNRLNTESCYGLPSIMNLISPLPTNQQFLYIFCPLSDWWTIKPITDENLALYTFNNLPNITLRTWMDNDEPREIRIKLFVQNITFREKKLYVCDCSSLQYLIVHVTDDAAFPCIKNGVWLNLYYVKSEAGILYIDKYSNVEIAPAMFSISLFPYVDFPTLTRESKIGEIVSLSGTIIGINKEKVYMSWRCKCDNEMACVVDYCNIYYCNKCNQCTSNCIKKMQLELFVHVTDLSARVKMVTHDHTVKEFLHKCGYNEVLLTNVKYNFSAVFGTTINALCVITHVAKNIENGNKFSTIIMNSEEDTADFRVEEIRISVT